MSVSPPLPTLLSAIAAEIALLSGPLETLSSLVADHVRQAEGEARVQALVEAQAVDEISQRLEALGEVATSVANGDPIESALDAVRLSDLAQRLRLAVLSQASPQTAVAPVTGDLMLFE